ncbi:hypothetical protein [Enterobacter cancerogenus]|uniref:hypothetical protein n=1 Tax=Enterobacter cancerogenus TaxID=69218 RepID=UPI00405A0C16
MTPDINLLRDNMDNLKELIDYLDIEFVDNPLWREPSDFSYLNERDLADPDILANVKAMKETNDLISWIGRDFEGYVGLWRGPENTTLSQAPIVRLDTEGQYSIVATSIPDYIAVSCDHEEFSNNRKLLISVGFRLSESVDDIWLSVDNIYRSANLYRGGLYNKDRVKRGLEPIDFF